MSEHEEEVIQRVWAVLEGELDEKYVTLEELEFFRELMNDVISSRVLH